MLIKNPVFTLEGTDYTGDVTSAELVGDTPIQQTRTLKPSTVITDVDSTTSVLNLTIVQGSPLHNCLLVTVAPGDLLDAVLQVEPGTGKTKATFIVASVVPSFGGDRGQTLTTQVSLPVSGAVAWSVSA